MPQPTGGIAEDIAAIADAIEQRRAEEDVAGRIAQALTRCRQSATGRREHEELQTVLETWQQVWPRLASQSEFRQAVAREARRWAERLSGTRS